MSTSIVYIEKDGNVRQISNDQVGTYVSIGYKVVDEKAYERAIALKSKKIAK